VAGHSIHFRTAGIDLDQFSDRNVDPRPQLWVLNTNRGRLQTVVDEVAGVRAATAHADEPTYKGEEEEDGEGKTWEGSPVYIFKFP